MIKRIFIFLILSAYGIVSLAQTDNYGFWIALEAEKKVYGNIELQFAISARTTGNPIYIGQYFAEGGLQYSFNRFLSVSGSYRIIRRREDDFKYYFRHKVFLELKSELPAGDFTLSGKLRIQRASETYIEDEDDLLAKYYTRIKLKTEYDIPKFPVTPFVYLEPFIPVQHGTPFEISRIRLGAGADLKINKKNRLQTGFIYQHDYGQTDANRKIMSVSYKIKF